METPGYIESLRIECSKLLDWSPKNHGLDGQNKPRSASLKKIILFGDSLIELSNDPRTEFPFASALAHVFRRRADILVRAASGYTSRWLSQEPLPQLAAELTALNKPNSPADPTSGNEVLMVVVCVGTNDSVLPGNPHHVPIQEFTNNLKNILHTIIKCSINTGSKQKLALFVVTPPQCSLQLINGPSSRLSASGRARSNKSVETYVKAVYEVVKQLQEEDSHKSVVIYEIIDMFKLMQDLSEGKLSNEKIPIESFLTDGVHYNGDGYRLLFHKIFTKFIEYESEGLLSCPLTQPHFSELISKEQVDKT